MRRRSFLMAGAAALLLNACSLPSDPDDTLERVRSTGVVRVGVASAPPMVDVSGGTPSGPEADLATAWAARQGASVTWVIGGLDELVDRMEHGEIDLLVGGLTTKSAISTQVALTRAWTTDLDPFGHTIERVVAAPLGENALVSDLEHWFDEGRP